MCSRLFLKNKDYKEKKNIQKQKSGNCKKRNFNKNEGNMKFNQADVVTEQKSCGIDSGIKFTETHSMKSSSF